jgi:hypothetical protein
VSRAGPLLEFFDDDIGVRVDADFAGDAQRRDGHLAGRQLRVFEQGAGGGQGVGAARADGERAAVRGDDVAVAGEEEGVALVGDDDEGFEVAQDFVGAPLFAELLDGALEVAAELFELALEAGEQRERVGARAGEADQDFVVVEAAHLARAALHHGVAHRDLAVAGHRHLPLAADEQDGRAADLCVVTAHRGKGTIGTGAKGSQAGPPAATRDGHAKKFTV